MQRRWLLLVLAMFILAACGPETETPTPAPRPEGAQPILWLYCPDCRAIKMNIPLLDSPGGKPVTGLPHQTFVLALAEQKGLDGQMYYYIWATGREGWVVASYLSENPSGPAGNIPPLSTLAARVSQATGVPQAIRVPETTVVLKPMPAQTHVGTPRIAMPERAYDFGDIPPDAPVKHVFVIQNTGVGDLVIQDVRSDCACTSILLGASLIPPGGEGQIEATFNPKNYAGQRVVRNIVIVSNDPLSPEFTLTLGASVREK
jgi:hypothetical protein